ncbi:hypothetical protein [Vibrio sp. D431a]|uniref:hypothetical protein n=1 Tax=Vibrio sp. D431a TaxID=2837388 RepID=UPI0025563C89|nr:hypothetical protein [Vibrio sp. D431a]MDK9793718.1 hypothetical protein [Vibrio sp. D431a]
MYLVELTLIEEDFDNNAELSLPVMLTDDQEKAIKMANKKFEEQKVKPESFDTKGFRLPDEIHISVHKITPDVDVHENKEHHELAYELKWDVVRKAMITD